jgi:glycosyltransferase involved in cell wall biosynthesis
MPINGVGGGDGFGQGTKGLIFMMSLNPVDDPTSGSGICHRDWAEVLTEEGYDVLVIESNNKYNELIGQVPYQIRSLLFDGRSKNPQLGRGEDNHYQEFEPAIPFNYGALKAATRSSFQFIHHTDGQLEANANSFGWAFRAAALTYGVPDMVWNGHTWVQNDISRGVPTIFTVHGTGAVGERHGGREKRLTPMIKRGMDGAFAVAAISEQERKNVVDYGADPNKVQIIYNGFNQRNFYPNRGVTKASLIERHAASDRRTLTGLDPDANWIIYFGRAIHFKGVDNLIEALPPVFEKFPNTHVIMIGPGDHSNIAVEGDDPINHFEMVEKLGLKDRVHFIGPLPPWEGADFISVADSYVLPSRNEPFGLVAIEGMATGKPPILSKSGGFIDIVTEYTGKDPRKMDKSDLDVARMVESEDIENPASRQRAIASLARALIDDLSESQEKRIARKEKGVAFAKEKFSVDAVVREKMMPLIRKAINEGERSDRWELVYRYGDHRLRRSERLNAIKKDDDVATAFNALKNSVGTAEFGAAWRRFDWEVTKYFGRAEFVHALDMDAMPDYRKNPNAIFSELSRAAGIQTKEMLQVMREVEKTPWQELVPLQAVGVRPPEPAVTEAEPQKIVLEGEGSAAEAYQTNWDNRVHIGLAYSFPMQGASGGYLGGSAKWTKMLADGLHRERPFSLRTPVYGFVSGQGQDKWVNAGPQQFRAVVETLRWYLDFTSVSGGIGRFDAFVPQHLSPSVVAGAHYMVANKAVVVAHGSGVYTNDDGTEGGWAAKNLRPYVLDAITRGNGNGLSKIVATSDRVASMLKENASIPAERIAVLGDPYDDTKYFPIQGGLTKAAFLGDLERAGVDLKTISTNGRWLSYVGGVEEFEGVEQLMRSWAVHVHSKDAHEDTVLVVGQGLDENSHFANMAAELGIQDNVLFLGVQSDSFINGMYNASDVAAKTSYGEVDNVLVKQPGATGTRIVATEAGEIGEYFNDGMGRLVSARNPMLRSSSERGLELITGTRDIQWGAKKLSNVEIVQDYIEWMQYSAKGNMTSDAQERVDVLREIVTNWDLDSVALRNSAVEVMRQEALGQFAYVPIERDGNMDFGKHVEFLADVFRNYGGRDVEVQRLADGYMKEFQISGSERAASSQKAQLFAKANFSIGRFNETVGELLLDAAGRTFTVLPEPAGGWGQTVVQGFAENSEASSMAVNISPEARTEVRRSFEQLQNYSNDRELIYGLERFNKAMVDVLSEPSIYPNHWPSPEGLGMKYDRRTENVVANISGIDASAVGHTRFRITQAISRRPELQEAINLMGVGHTSRVASMLEMGGGTMLPGIRTVATRGVRA